MTFPLYPHIKDSLLPNNGIMLLALCTCEFLCGWVCARAPALMADLGLVLTAALLLGRTSGSSTVSSAQFKMVSRCSGKPIRPPRLSDLSSVLWL